MPGAHISVAHQYLTFHLENELYAVDVKGVREVLEVPKITKIPRMPAFMKGVINLRGSVVPVIDLRLKLELPDTQQTEETSIIILEIGHLDEELMVGAFVDSVSEVIEIEQESIEPAPKFSTSINTEFIQGIGKLNEEFIIILNTARVFSEEELGILSSANREAPEEEA